MTSQNIQKLFIQHFGVSPTLIVRSPGRINIIGEHTDYNEGLVLPASIDKSIFFAVSKREDSTCCFVAADLNETFQTSINDFSFNPKYLWANYLMGVFQEMLVSENPIKPTNGINVVFGGNLPIGSGISSSAALENGIGFALNEVFDLGYTKMELVVKSQLAENNFVGMKCGIMDMFASIMGKKEHLILIDCRDLSYKYVPFFTSDLTLVLCNTMVKHSLIDSGYNTRRMECQEGVSILQTIDNSILSLRDVSHDFLEANKQSLPSRVYIRCKYVIDEIARVKKSVTALENNDFKMLGNLLYQTHEGLNTEYEVSCEELNYLVDFTKEKPYVLGARMMGGGFGGCTINLVKQPYVEKFIEEIRTNYLEKYQIQMDINIVSPENGVEILNLN